MVEDKALIKTKIDKFANESQLGVLIRLIIIIEIAIILVVDLRILFIYFF